LVKTTYSWLPLLTRNMPLVGRVFTAGSVTIQGSATMRLEAPSGATLNYSQGAGGTGSCP
jgi:hypothetical protein